MIILEPDGRLSDARAATPGAALHTPIDALVQAHLEEALQQTAARLAKLSAAAHQRCADGHLIVEPS
ncbi:hypothetical protein [Kallotenue papyrolyticum]|uniref:hypothetical protein n=1 Tax=Kallotenue papyrolyticum TaxID=1325125 RepID=UPI0004785DFF|nr:hypothetical protein [Kallotenue papyrolyticum]